MRIIYTFCKKNRYWIVSCPSKRSIKDSNYNSLLEAINNLLVRYADIEFFDIVIPQSMPKAIPFTKPIRKRKKRAKVDNKRWAIITPPYDKQNILVVHAPYYFRKKQQFFD